MKNKDQLFDVESWLYDEYGSIEEVLETIEWYFDEEENSYAEFIEEVLDNYGYDWYDWDDADVMQIYEDFAFARNVEYYSWDGALWLELSDDPIMWKINADISEATYWMLADEFTSKFEEEYNVSDVVYGGRSSRHLLCPNTWENVVRYDDLVAGAEKYQQEFVDYINHNYGV